MSEELAVRPESRLAVPSGGIGLDFTSKAFRLKPATLTINQRMTQLESAIPGKLRIVETGQQFDTLRVALLVMPQISRKFYEGEKGSFNRTQENLMCFSNDMRKPDIRSRVPQCLSCATCPMATWDNSTTPATAPLCAPQWYALMVDTTTGIPLRMFIRGASKKPWEAGMENLARTFRMLQESGHNPNLFDLEFTLTTETHKKQKTTYIIKLDTTDCKLVSPEQSAKYYELHKQASNVETGTDDDTETQKVASTIDAQVIEPGGDDVIEGEIVI